MVLSRIIDVNYDLRVFLTECTFIGCSEVLRVLRALDFDIPDKRTEDFLMAQIDQNQDSSVNAAELEKALSKESFYQVVQLLLKCFFVHLCKAPFRAD